MATIIVQTGDKSGDYYLLGHRTTVIGRDEALPFQILDDRISRKHMRIRYNDQENKYSVYDMESKHGVLVNGRRIRAETVLSDGDYITIGKTTLLFTLKDFPSLESALHHFKKAGERQNPTIVD